MKPSSLPAVFFPATRGIVFKDIGGIRPSSAAVKHHRFKGTNIALKHAA